MDEVLCEWQIDRKVREVPIFMKNIYLLGLILFSATSTWAEPLKDRLRFSFNLQCQESISGQIHSIKIQRHYSMKQDRIIDQTTLNLADRSFVSGKMSVRSNAGVDQIVTSFLQKDGLSLDFVMVVEYRARDACHDEQMNILTARTRIPGTMQYLDLNCQAGN